MTSPLSLVAEDNDAWIDISYARSMSNLKFQWLTPTQNVVKFDSPTC